MNLFTLPVLRIALVAVALNAAWELVQCAIFFDMWGWGFWTNTVWMSLAIVIDVGLVLGILWFSSWIAGHRNLLAVTGSGAGALVLIGAMTGLGVEWAAKAMTLWSYGENMPEVTLFGVAVGLTPVLQMAILPLLSVLIAARRWSI